MGQVSEKGITVIKAFEGRALKAYRDAVGVWTIGFGNTNMDNWAVSYLGRAIGAGLTITEEQANYLLRESLKRGYLPGTEKAMPGAKQNDLDAGVSFHYNTGAIGRASWVAKWRAKAGAAAIRAGLMQYNKGGGRVLAGLTRRRSREAAIINSSDYGPEGRQRPPVLNAGGKVVGTVPVESPDHELAGTPGMLRLGDKGAEVAELNADLKALGFTVPQSDTYSEATKKAVTAIQKSHKQTNPDGVTGPATRAVIKREADGKRKLITSAAATGAPGGSVAGADQYMQAGLPTWVYVLLGAIFVAAVGWVVWKYRDELIGYAKRKIGG